MVLLLNACAKSEKVLEVRKKAKAFKYNGTSILSTKPGGWSWFGFIYRGAYHGYGNTPQEANDKAKKTCEENKKKKFANKNLYCLEPIIYMGRKRLGILSEINK